MNWLNWIRRSSAACALFTAAVAVHAAPTLWVATGGTANGAQLATVDVATGATTVVANTRVVFSDIAFSPSGDLYGIGLSGLYRVNMLTGASALIGGFGFGQGSGLGGNALVFGSDGTLYMAGGRSLYTVNTTTGAASSVGLMGFVSGGDLAFVGGNLYLSTTDSQLVQLDITTGAGTSIGNMGVMRMFGLATPDNVNLYGVADQSLYRINTTTGAATLQASFNPSLSMIAFGLAFFEEAGASSVPEPGTLALVGLALLGAAAAKRRSGSTGG
jgi:hypothetical protein